MALNQVKILGRAPLGPVRQAQPLYAADVPAGFPSPADDYIDCHLDLHEHLIKHPAATFYVRVSGTSMVGAGIHNGDLLIVDRAVQPRDGHVIVAVVEGELVVKRLRRRLGRIDLVSDSDAYPPLAITEDMDLHVWGVCRYVIHGL